MTYSNIQKVDIHWELYADPSIRPSLGKAVSVGPAGKAAYYSTGCGGSRKAVKGQDWLVRPEGWN